MTAPSKWVHVQFDTGGNPIRIFRDKSWRDFPPEVIGTMNRALAVKLIRLQVYERALDPVEKTWHECEACGRYIDWNTMEMHERFPKGKGGEVSVKNCMALCHECHTGSPDSAHGDRRWQTAKLSPKVSNE